MHIDSVMMAIKPGLCQIYCYSYTKQMIYEHLRDIKYRNSGISDGKVAPSQTQTPQGSAA